MGSRTLEIGSLVVSDAANSIVETPTVIPTQRKKRASAKPIKDVKNANVSGRRAFAVGVCEIHPDGTPENPCPVFSHLDPNGRGPIQPGRFRKFRGVITAPVKPVLFVSVGIAIVYLFAHFVLGSVRLQQFIPKSTNGGVSNSVRHTPSNKSHHPRHLRRHVPAEHTSWTSSIPVTTSAVDYVTDDSTPTPTPTITVTSTITANPTHAAVNTSSDDNPFGNWDLSGITAMGGGILVLSSLGFSVMLITIYTRKVAGYEGHHVDD